MDGVKKVVKDLSVIGLSKIFTTLSGIFLLTVLTKILGAYGYGLWSQALVTISFSLVILRLGFDFSIVRIFPGKELKRIQEDLHSIILLVVLVAGIFSILLYSFPYVLADSIFDGQVVIVRILAAIIFMNCLEIIFVNVFQAFREMKKCAFIDIICRYSEMLLIIFFVFLGYGLVGALIAILIVRGSTSLILFLFIRRRYSFRKPQFKPLKEYLYLGLPTIPSAFSHLIVNLSDRYVIGFFLGATFVGYYSPAYTLGMTMPIFIAGILSFVLLPNLSKYYENNKIDLVKNLLNLSIKYFLLISIPSCIGIILLGGPILLLFTTPEIALNGYIILVLTAFVGILYGLFEIFKQTIFLKKRTDLLMYFWGFGAVINLIGNIIFVPNYGIIAAGATTVLSYFLVLSMVLHFSYKEFTIPIEYKVIAKIIFSSLLMGVSLFLINKYLMDNVFLLILLGLCQYFIILYIVKGLKKEDLKFLIKIIFGKKWGKY